MVVQFESFLINASQPAKEPNPIARSIARFLPVCSIFLARHRAEARCE